MCIDKYLCTCRFCALAHEYVIYFKLTIYLKRLCDLKINIIKTNIDITKIRANNEDFVLSDLSKCLNVKTRNDIIVRSYLEYARK